jgi:integrase
MDVDARRQDTKNGQARIFTLSPTLKTIMQRRLSDRALGCPFIFHQDGQRIGDRGRWLEAWMRAGLPTRTTKAGHERPAKLFHDLRRTAVTNMIDAGIDPQIAMEISGHKTHEIFRRYHITSRKAVAAALEKLDAHVGTLPTEAPGPIRRLVPRTVYLARYAAQLARKKA